MTRANELHVIFGSGPVGTAVVELLLAQGKRVRVVTRSGARKHLPAQAEVVRGNATDPADTRRLTVGATHVYNATNPVDAHRWPEQFPPLQRGVLTSAAPGCHSAADELGRLTSLGEPAQAGFPLA